MRYNKIEKCECSNGEGWGVSLYVQGCPLTLHCKGCFNPETWDFNGGKKFTEREKSQLYQLLNKDYITRFSILGGEPLAPQNVYDVASLVLWIANQLPHTEIWMWTGYTKEQLGQRLKEARESWPSTSEDMFLQAALVKVDYLIAGPFIEEQKDLTLQWRGSRNQEIIDMSKDRKWLYG